MAETVIGVNDPQARKVWSQKLAKEATKKAWVGKFIGKSENSLIQEHKDVKKNPGDQIKYDLRTLLRGTGVAGDAILKGSEEKQTYYQDSIVVDQLRHAVSRGGRMSQQRTWHDLRKGCNELLSDWWAQRMDRTFFNVLAGYTATDIVDEFGELYQGSDVRYTGMQASTAPTSGYHFWSEANADKDEDLDSTGDNMALSLIDDLVVEAKLKSPSIRPIKIEGNDHYVLFLHPKQVRDLRKDATTAGGWFDIQKAAMQGGKVSDNPIFSGALGMYNNVILHESPRVPRGITSTTGLSIATVRRAVFCGAQSCALAFGQGSDFEGWEWAEEEDDYGNQLGVGAGAIWGMKKTKFNSKDFATLVLSTYAA